MNNRLILIEGLCGTGKTTTAGQLTSYLNSHGCPAVFYDEGAFPHPASLNGHAYLTLSEYDNLLRAFPDNAELLRSLAITEEGAVLIPYNGDVISQNEALQTRLWERELCWTNTPVAGLSAFSGAIQRSWARLAASPAMEGLVHVLEGVFLQHPIHDLTRLYHCAYTDIESHVMGVADVIAPLRPTMIYLSHADVRAQQLWIGAQRGKPHYAEDAHIRAAERRKEQELRLAERLPFPCRIIDSGHRDWSIILDAILHALSVGG